MKSNKLPLWRSFLIGLFMMVAFSVSIVLINIDRIIDYHLEPVTDDVHEYVDNHFGYSALSEEQQMKFEKQNRDLLDKYSTLGNKDRTAEILYMNQLYIKTYGKNAFNESISCDNGEDAYIKRKAQLRERAYVQLYSKWEKEHHRYTELSQKEDEERKNTTYILYPTMLFCGVCIYLLSFRKVERKNRQAYTLMVYCVICEILSIIIASIPFALDENTINGSYGLWALLFFPSVLINPIIMAYLSKRSIEEKQDHLLIPLWLTKTNIVNSELSKRLFLAFIAYPLFYLVPIPFGSIYVFILYIIPMSFIFAINYIIIWIAKGRKIDKTSECHQQKTMIYCRFCGKLIDADSDYCRYCGKKL